MEETRQDSRVFGGPDNNGFVASPDGNLGSP